MTRTNFLRCLLLMSLLACGRPAATGELRLKMVSDGSGAITFAVPFGWKEEADTDGGRMFYADEPDSGTLRVSVITAKFPKQKTENSALELLSSLITKDKRPAEVLPDGNAFFTFTEPGFEDGEALHMTYWRIGGRAGPGHVRIAMFSYTLAKGQEKEERFKKELVAIDAAIRKAAWNDTPVPANAPGH